MEACAYLQVVITRFAARCQTAVRSTRRGTLQPRRISSCQSTNHTECYGELWECARCGKKICFAEGTDEEFNLCDDCWAQQNV